MLVTFLPFVLLALVVFLLPPNWGLRAWALAALPLVWSWVLHPITPFQNQAPLDGLQDVLDLWILAFATLGVAARAFWTLALAPLDLSSLSKDMLVPDCILAGLYGLVAGVGATLLLAAGLRGLTGGLALHLGVAGLASVGAYAAMRLPQRPRCMTVIALSTILFLTLAGGVAYPKFIHAKAEAIQRGAPRCLRTPNGKAPTTDQLRLLTLPQALGRRPNLVLTVMTESGQRDFRWSYRSFGFRSYDSYPAAPARHPDACPAPRPLQ
ncbi:hypothetical protein [Rhodobacter sp. SY28-1]|uniref:hypothetical protein n=1 Tax=Rhodobacter sp. SY28-1 TaxID=2562317 RepID=UPI0010C0BC18|nr:hypothetical protein [Rhodobacter sp. SY28-1]